VTALIVIIAAAVGTFGLRASMLVGLAGRQLPASIQTGLALVGPAALAALCAASLGPNPSRGIVWAEVLAAAAAFIAVRRSRSITHAFLVGLPVLWFAHAVGLS
jgi:branched-subunit amino acid transport protein